METALKKIGAQNSTVDQIVDNMVQAISNKEWKPGTKIPSELVLCETFGVGRNSVREGVKILVASGLLEIRRPGGTFVVERFNDKMLNPLYYSFLLEDEESVSLIEFRKIFEIGSIQLAMQKATEKDLNALQEACDKYTALLSKDPLDDAETLLKCDTEYHNCICKAGHNRLVERMNSVIAKVSHYSRLKAMKSNIVSGDMQFLIDSHKQLTDSIINRDVLKASDVVTNSFKYWNID